MVALAPPALRRADGESPLTALRGLVSEALACCLDAGRVVEGVLLFQRGRGVILRQALATRTDLTELTEVVPDLAARLHALRTALSAPEGETPSPANTGLRVDPLDWPRRHHRSGGEAPPASPTRSKWSSDGSAPKRPYPAYRTRPVWPS
ncbi:hypothetical protein [Streptomyces cyaneofuscatus]|uniref:hypothetical protein n=1 Tax=Streptomyces cyaneofuscatus TaxID=66883 RepID=UPI0036CBE96E